MPTRPPVFRLGQSTPRKPWDHGGRTGQQRGYGAAWRKLRAIVLARDRHLCETCPRAGLVTPAKAVDHIVPKAKGGTDDLENLEANREPCHRDKTIADQGKRVRRAIDVTGWPIE